jgi:hypothetical protein
MADADRDVLLRVRIEIEDDAASSVREDRAGKAADIALLDDAVLLEMALALTHTDNNQYAEPWDDAFLSSFSLGQSAENFSSANLFKASPNSASRSLERLSKRWLCW